MINFDEVADPEEKKIIQKRFSVDVVKELHQHLLFSIPTGLLCASIIFYILSQTANNLLLKSWYVAMIIVFILRFVQLAFYHYSPQFTKLHFSLFILGLTLIAILWGIAGSLLMPKDNLLQQTLIIIVLAGITAGGTQLFQGSNIASYIYLIFSLLPLCIWLASQGGATYNLLSLATFVYLLYMLMVARRNYQLLFTFYHLYYKNESLVRRIQKIAYHDVLTGLANRKQLEDSFKFALSFAKRHQKLLAVIFMDLDRFKTINDTLGHEAGDFLLITFAQRLQSIIRDSDIIARLGGDEIIIIITELSDLETVSLIAKNILAKISEPMLIKNRTVQITASMGISIYPKDGQELKFLMSNADKALYLAKSAGRNNFKFFS